MTKPPDKKPTSTESIDDQWGETKPEKKEPVVTKKDVEKDQREPSASAETTEKKPENKQKLATPPPAPAKRETDEFPLPKPLTTAPPPQPGLSSLRALLVLIVLVGLSISVGLSYFNSKRYYLICGDSVLAPARGRYFMWGHATLEGKKWKGVPLQPNAQCTPMEFPSKESMEQVFTEKLIGAISSELSPGPPKDLPALEEAITQALLLTRTEGRAELRILTERLQGDVEFFYGKAELAKAKAAAEAAKMRFRQAQKKQPRHQKDAQKWQRYSEKIDAELVRGPSSAEKGDSATPEKKVTLPEEPPAKEIEKILNSTPNDKQPKEPVVEKPKGQGVLL